MTLLRRRLFRWTAFLLLMITPVLAAMVATMPQGKPHAVLFALRQDLLGGKVQHWGPYRCTACRLRTPLPDPGSLGFIGWQDAHNHRGVLGIGKSPGDIYELCDSRYCVEYIRSNDNKFKGGELKLIADQAVAKTSP